MKYLDCILVPIGILTMVAYHIWLLHRIIRHPINTIIGVNAISRRFWVHSMMEVRLYLLNLSFYTIVGYLKFYLGLIPASKDVFLLFSLHFLLCTRAGCGEEWSSCGADFKKQHHGFDSIGIDSNHVKLSHCTLDVEWCW